MPEPPQRAKRWRRGLGQDGSRADHILFSGDIHCKGTKICPIIEEAADRTDAGTIVLLGDLLNEWGISAAGEIAAFERLAEWVNRQREQREVVVLLGHHDLTYWADSAMADHRAFRDTCPGYNDGAYPDVHYLLHMMRPRLAYGFADARGNQVLASHAGVTQAWWEWMIGKLADAGEPLPGEPLSNKPLPDETLPGGDSAEKTGARSPIPGAAQVADAIDAFAQGHIAGGIRPFGVMVGYERGGWPGSIPSPVWTGMEELALDPLAGYRQIVGHTPVTTTLYRRCGIGTGAPAAAGRQSGRHRAELWYCDTHSLYRNGRPIGDDSLLLYDRAAGGAWSVTPHTQ
ncbi:metallophosphoesterase [Bifidobacterium stellenboschense]|uniref:Ser/Thr phosphatase family protein n=1 Tax=Bifidobacterium stellenboschense TaxID=762211 RepID=A0A087DJI6_9BIFI|nr:metallophosphoesterase [Bifidobacterium stellenboschense]KFI95686.1 Ser/Thr phosphatase family protein [Bifidobacterium stellenboschense]